MHLAGGCAGGRVPYFPCVAGRKGYLSKRAEDVAFIDSRRAGHCLAALLRSLGKNVGQDMHVMAY